jgi:hypothetical protein
MASEQVLSIEELLRALPWMRWGELFAIVGMCMDEGILVLEKRGFEFDVRLKGTTSSVEHPNGQSTFGLKYKHLDRTRSRYLTRS